MQALDREENSTYTMEVIAVDGRTFFYEEKHYQNRFYSSRNPARTFYANINLINWSAQQREYREKHSECLQLNTT